MQKFGRLPDLSLSKSNTPAAAPISYPAGGDDDVSCFLFSHARTALKHGMKALNIGKGDRVLMPDFNCDVAVHPVEQLGAKPVFYPVTNSLAPNWAKLKKMAKGCRAILMVHYFGVAQDTTKFREFCKTNNLLLLEDNAHGLGGVSDGKALGTIGDIGIASPRKVLPLVNGGALWISSKYEVAVSKTGLGAAPIEKSGLKPVLKGIAEKIPGAVKLLRRNRPDYHDDSAFQETEIPDWAMDAQAVEQLNAVDWYETSQARRKIYDVWQRWAVSGGREKSLISVFGPLPEGASPMVFAAWARDETTRNKWLDWGFDRRIDVHTWPSLPAEILQDRKSKAREQWGKLVCFPIHQDMDPAGLEAVIS